MKLNELNLVTFIADKAKKYIKPEDMNLYTLFSLSESFKFNTDSKVFDYINYVLNNKQFPDLNNKLTFTPNSNKINILQKIYKNEI